MPALTPTAIVCSINRPEILHESVLGLTRQTAPCNILISIPSEQHILPETIALPNVKASFGAMGTCAQRNAALRLIQDQPGVIFFFDDDVEVEAHYIQYMLQLFQEHPEVVLANGNNVGHGARAGTLNRERARELILANLLQLAIPSIEPARTGFGCMMCFRGSLLGQVHFDERLPLYGYQEDFDFSLLCRQYGQIVTNRRALIVHIEMAEGRMGSRKRGYSEVVNPFYIWSKGRGAKLTRILGGAVKRTLKNMVRCHTADGRKQLQGNLIGWAMIATGKYEPEYILRISD